METYVALLRGINVSGKKIVPMPELKKLFMAAGFSDVTTYINSGNVVFRAARANPESIRSLIEEGIEARFGFEVKVIVVQLRELRRYLDGCPYDENDLKGRESIYMTVLSALPSKAAMAAAEGGAGGRDEHLFVGKVVYLLVKDGYTKTRLNNTFLERKLGVDATTRNINTLRKITEIGEKAD